MIHGKKTKTGCIIMLIAAVIVLLHISAGASLFMIGCALAFYGLYDRREKDRQHHADKIDELKSRIKKPMLRGGI